jgi:C-terminal processing protease CtpA/Prc
MELKGFTSKKTVLSFLIIALQFFTSNYIFGEKGWSVEYILEKDSSVYTLSQDKIIQGNAINFFFPAYKYSQTSLMSAIESIKKEDIEIIELKFESKYKLYSEINFEVDIYSEGIDTIQFFLKTKDGNSILLSQKSVRQGYKYLPTSYFTIDLTNSVFSSDFNSIQIIGKAKEKERKFAVGRFDGFKKVLFTANNKTEAEIFVSNYSFDQQSDIFYELPDHYSKLHGFSWYNKLVLNNCYSSYDSIQCISQFTSKILNEYELYDIYGIDKQALINSNAILANTSGDVVSYYTGMKEILSSLNSCHMRLATDKNDEIESPLQPVYFYSMNNEIIVSAIFDPTLDNKIQLGDKLLSINSVPITQLYKDFSKYIFASTSHQREMKITQKLLYMAKELFGDSLSITFQNKATVYSINLSSSNFSNKKIIPVGFKTFPDNIIEKHNNMLYIKLSLQESTVVPFIYSHIKELDNSNGLVIDLRGCTGGDYSFCTLFSLLISETSPIVHSASNTFNTRSTVIVKPSRQLDIKCPVSILVDARTACSAELLISGLRKNRQDVSVMGVSNTAGSAQLNMKTLLPLNAILTHFEGITEDAFGHVIDNNKGLIPDIVIHFDSYKDLFPYNDKLKYYALEYLKTKQ